LKKGKVKALFSANERRCNAKPFLEKLRQEIGAITTIDSEEKESNDERCGGQNFGLLVATSSHDCRILKNLLASSSIYIFVLMIVNVLLFPGN
jgi:hypothetical protein